MTCTLTRYSVNMRANDKIGTNARRIYIIFITGQGFEVKTFIFSWKLFMQPIALKYLDNLTLMVCKRPSISTDNNASTAPDFCMVSTFNVFLLSIAPPGVKISADHSVFTAKLFDSSTADVSSTFDFSNIAFNHELSEFWKEINFSYLYAPTNKLWRASESCFQTLTLQQLTFKWSTASKEVVNEIPEKKRKKRERKKDETSLQRITMCKKTYWSNCNKLDITGEKLVKLRSNNIAYIQ